LDWLNNRGIVILRFVDQHPHQIGRVKVALGFREMPCRIKIKKWPLVGAICEFTPEFQEAALVLTRLVAGVCLTTTFLPACAKMETKVSKARTSRQQEPAAVPD
jgi:hypothetical protein